MKKVTYPGLEGATPKEKHNRSSRTGGKASSSKTPMSGEKPGRADHTKGIGNKGINWKGENSHWPKGK